MRGFQLFVIGLLALFFAQGGLQSAPVADTGKVRSEPRNASGNGSQTPEEAVRAMHEALCAGDFQAFDNVVDLDRAFQEIAAAEVADKNHLSTREKERRIRFFISQIKRELRNSIATEDYSVNCKAQAVLESQDGNRARVISRLPTREDRFVLLEKSDGRWTVVSLETGRSAKKNTPRTASAGKGSDSNPSRTSLGEDVAGPTWGADPESPLETARRIQEAACAGDDDEFMRFMDTQAVIDNSMERIMERKGVARDSRAHRMLLDRRVELARGLEKKIRSQIREGRGGRDCHYNVRVLEKQGDRAVVEIQLDGGRPSHIYLEKKNSGLWVIINLLRPDGESDDIENSEHYVLYPITVPAR